MTKISILLPTRERPDLVSVSITSLISNAADPSRIEVLIAIDDDDEISQKFFDGEDWSAITSEFSTTQFHVHQTPRYGYLGLFRYVNFLGAESTGDYVMFWNDDATMLTQDWDLEIDRNNEYFGLLRMPCTNHKHPFALFPIIPRKWIDLFGCISLVNHSDWWIYNVCRPINRVKDINVEVFHNRADITGDNNDAVFKSNSYALDGRNPNHLDDYSHPQRRLDRENWTNMLMLYGFPHRNPDDE